MNHSEEMKSYYNEVALDYDMIYKRAIWTKLEKEDWEHKDHIFFNDNLQMSKLVSEFGKGHVIDIGCGTGFWIEFYEKNCEQVTMLDQSSNMIRLCKDRIEQNNLLHKVNLIEGNFFDCSLEKNSYDGIVLGFILSHYPHIKIEELFYKVNLLLKQKSQLLLLDSLCSHEKARVKNRKKIQKRYLPDGRKFNIYKKYFDLESINNLLNRFHFQVGKTYIGSLFFGILAKYS